MANLAFKFIEAGCLSDVAELIGKARRMEDPHPQVAKAFAALEKRKKDDDDKWGELAGKAADFQRESRAFGSALFDQNRAAVSFDGTWLVNGCEIKVEETANGNVSAEWKVSRPLNLGIAAQAGLLGAQSQTTDKFTIRGKRRNGTVVVTYKKESESGRVSLLDSPINIECLSYVTPDGMEWHIFSKEPDKELRLIARRESIDPA